MMLHRNLQKMIVGAIICLVVFYTISPSVFATEPHQDPEIAEPVFSGISLFRYYSNSLDFVLKKEPAEVEARLKKMPFASVPQNLREVTNDFAASSIGVSHLVVDIDEDLSKLRTLMGQYRFDEATVLADETYSKLSLADGEVERTEEATKTTGREFKVPSAPVGSDLRKSYNKVLEGIEKIREMLNLRREILANLLLGAVPTEELMEMLGEKGITTEELMEILGELMNPTELTLKIEPIVAFVGDSIRFEGTLTSPGNPLVRREVDILLNGSRYLTARTGTDGHYQGTLQVPYWYIPEMDLQALYYPRDEDIGLYIASLSPVVKLEVLYYEAGLEVTVEDKAYPGWETMVSGKFNYGQSPPLVERKVEIYLDDVFITELKTEEEFSQEIELSPELDIGKHTVTVSAVAAERYSPVVASAILDVSKAPLILDINIPAVAMIPGGISLGGKLYSEVGPVSGAQIRMGLGKSQVELVSSEDGTFDTEIKMGMGFTLIGSQDLGIQVIPQEPWHSTLTTTRNMVVMNMVNCGGILILLAFLAIFLPGRLRGRLRMYSWRRARPAIAIAQSESAPAYSEAVLVPALTEGSGETDGEPQNRIFYWYRLVLRLVQRMSRALLRPQQTLREFAKESSRVLGPAAKYFIELTRMVEKLLYSQYRPTEGDVEKSKQLSHTIEEELKGEGV